MAKKVLLINGPSQDPSDRFFGWPTPLLYAVAPSVAKAREGKLDVEFISPIFDPIWYESQSKLRIDRELESIVDKEEPDIVCGSTIYDSVYPTLCLFDKIKRINPDTKTIFGGPHFDEVHTLDRFSDIKLRPDLIDIAIAGDGEHALFETLRSISNGMLLADVDWNDVEGRATVYTNDGSTYQTNGKPIDLNSLPFIPIEFVNINRHKNDFDIFVDSKGQIIPTVQMIAARGCPYTCNFCSENRNLAYPNTRSIDSLIEEIELRKSQGFGAVFFDDSTFGAYPQIKDLLIELGKTGMKFGSLNRFNLLTNPAKVEAYRNAGFSYVYAAIEQFDDSALKSMNKSQKEKTIKDSMLVLNNLGFNVGVSLLYGLPYETEDTIRKTLDFTAEWVDRGLIKLVSESVLSYHPGTLAGSSLTGDFHRTPPNKGHPFNRFEEGQWYHPEHVNADYLDEILDISQKRFGKVMVRNKHSWHSENGRILN